MLYEGICVALRTTGMKLVVLLVLVRVTRVPVELVDVTEVTLGPVCVEVLVRVEVKLVEELVMEVDVCVMEVDVCVSVVKVLLVTVAVSVLVVVEGRYPVIVLVELVVVTTVAVVVLGGMGSGVQYVISFFASSLSSFGLASCKVAIATMRCICCVSVSVFSVFKMRVKGPFSH